MLKSSEQKENPHVLNLVFKLDLLIPKFILILNSKNRSPELNLSLSVSVFALFENLIKPFVNCGILSEYKFIEGYSYHFQKVLIVCFNINISIVNKRWRAFIGFKR